MEALLYKLHLRLLSWGANTTKDKGRFLAGSKLEFGGHIPGLFSQGNSGVQSQRRTNITGWRENCVPVFNSYRVTRPCIVKSRPASHLEIDLAPDNSQCADNLVLLLTVVPNGHVIRQLGHALLCKKSRE